MPTSDDSNPGRIIANVHAIPLDPSGGEEVALVQAEWIVRVLLVDNNEDEYLAKPFRAEELYSTVAKLTRERIPTPKIETAEPPIDMATARELLEGDTELLAELAGLFADEYPELYERLETAVAESDLRTAGKTAHRLKGSLGTLSALPAMEAAAALEKAGKAEDAEEVSLRWADFNAEMDRLEPEIVKMIGRPLLPS